MLVLGIESSCDDTSIALLRGPDQVLSMVRLSQDHLHQPFGGVVPEIAARAHARSIFDVLDQALNEASVHLNQIDLFCATAGPGLIGSLLVGLQLGKALAFAEQKPFLAIHHLEAHFSAVSLSQKPVFPCLGLLLSGGHSCLYYLPAPGIYEVMGETRDDAVGEVYDKAGRALGLSQPAGPLMDALARTAVSGASFTPPLKHSPDYDFSFSGLKTACLKALEQGRSASDIAFGLQNAVVEVLVHKAKRAMHEKKTSYLILAGGVAANSAIRQGLKALCMEQGGELFCPEMKYCMDNGAMVARSGYEQYQMGRRSNLSVQAFSRMSLEGLSNWTRS